MQTDLNTAFNVLLVGMTAVILILFMVIAMARLVIAITNHFSSESVVHIKGRNVRAGKGSEIPNEHIIAIATALSRVHKRGGKIISIKKS